VSFFTFLILNKAFKRFKKKILIQTIKFIKNQEKKKKKLQKTKKIQIN